MKTAPPVIVPELEIDKKLRIDPAVLPRCRTERRIVANLIHMLEGHGFKVRFVNDGDSDIPVAGMKAAMEELFNLDDGWLLFRRDDEETHEWVRLVFSNGVDCISDYSCGGPFGKVVDDFKPEQFA